MENKKLINEFMVLNGSGYYSDSSNGGQSSWNNVIPLEVGQSLNGLSYKVVISKVTDYYVEVEVYKVEYSNTTKKSEDIFKYKYKLTDCSKVYIDKYNHTSGRYDDFVSYSGEFTICLQESFTLKMNKLIESIDTNVESIKSLLNNEDTYYKVFKRLNVLKFRASDKKYGEKISLENNEEAIKEKQLITDKINVIDQIINDITLYEKSFTGFIEYASYYGVNQQDYKTLFKYLNALANDYSRDIELDPSMLRKVLNDLMKYSWFNVMDQACLSYVLLLIYERTRYYFRGNSVALGLEKILEKDNFATIPNEYVYEFYYELGKFYNRICDRKKAMDLYHKAAIVIKTIDLEKAAYAMGEYYKINGVFPDDLKQTVDIKKIEEEYKEYANIIIAKINYKSLKVDEVEFTPKFIKFFVSFSEETEIKLEKIGDIHSVYQRWSIMQEILRERYKIEWKTPKEMNPNVMFD